MNKSDEWKEITDIHLRSLHVWRILDEELSDEEKSILSDAQAWIGRNPELISDMLKLSMGEIEIGFGHYTVSPLLLEALGLSGKTEIIAPIEEKLSNCRWSICLDSRYLMKALILLDKPESHRAIKRLVKKDFWGRKNHLIIDFIDGMYKNPTSSLLPILLDIVRKTGIDFRVDIIIAKLTEECNISFENLLGDKSKYVRRTAINALNISDDRYITEPVIEMLKRVVNNEREDILCRSNAADILKKKDIEVPRQFRDRKWENVSSDIERFVRGVLYPNSRPDDWALSEVFETLYDDKQTFIRIHSNSGMIFAEPHFHHNGQWKKLTIGFQIVKEKNDQYQIRGIGLSIQFKRGSFPEDYIIHNLDRIIIAIADDLLNFSKKSSS